jgi:hypothetical protein
MYYNSNYRCTIGKPQSTHTQSGGGGGDKRRVGTSGGEGKGVSERETVVFLVGVVLYWNPHKLESQLLAKLISHNTHTHIGE